MTLTGTTVYNPSFPIFLTELDTECFDTEKMTLEEWEKFFSTHSNNFISYYTEDTKVIGASIITFSPNNIAYLYSIAVLPQYRKLNIGEGLLGSAIAYVQQSVYTIQAHTRVENVPMIQLLRKYQFKPAAYIPDYFGDFEDGILWEYRTGLE